MKRTWVLRIGRVPADLKALFVVLLEKRKPRKLEKRHAEGYTKFPVEKGEVDIWLDEQVWETKGT